MLVNRKKFCNFGDMAFEKGNKLWQKRAKHGRDKIFSTADDLWNAAVEYFKYCDDNPWIKYEAIKSGEMAGELIQIPVSRPYTLTALCIFLGVNTKYFSDFKKALKENESDFSEVVSRIEETIYSQKFEGATVGAFNANIIARDLGLVDKQETKNETKLEQVTIFQLPDNKR